MPGSGDNAIRIPVSNPPAEVAGRLPVRVSSASQQHTSSRRSGPGRIDGEPEEVPPTMTSLAPRRPFYPQPRLILFDLDNTICDYRTARITRTRHAFSPWFQAEGDLEEAVHAAMQYPTEGDEHLAEVLADYGIDASGVAELARQRFVEDRFRGLRLFEEALDAIAVISEVASVGLVTNGPSTIQRAKIEMFRLEARFPVIVVSEEVGSWKPDPRIFAIALERSGHRPEDAIYVGDSADHDIPGARAAGMRSVWVNRWGMTWPGGEEPDASIATL
ncbi:MAG TPA: hypothetical protein DCX80_13940, partial [Chloroflexi bacterium]|nr:hypothetical protein [Chloroflexota bacterium]